MNLSQEFPGFDVQFEEQPEDEFEGFDVQFLSEQKEPLKPVSEFVRQPLRLAKSVSSAIGGMPGNVQQLLNAAGDFIQSIPEYVTPASVSENLRKRREKVSGIMSGFTLPTSEEIKESQAQGVQELAQALGYDLDIRAKTPGERISEDVIGGAAEAPLWGSAKLPFAAAAFGSSLAREQDMGLLGQLAGGAAGAYGASLIPKIIRGAGYLAPTVKQTEAMQAKLLAKEAELKPKQLRKDLVDAAKKENIKLPPALLYDNEVLENAYVRALESPASGNLQQRQIKEISNQIVEKYKALPETISGIVEKDKDNLGMAWQNQLKKWVKFERDQISNLYEQSREDIKNSQWKVNVADYFKYNEELIENLDETLIKGTEKQNAFNKAKESFENLKPFVYKNVPVKLDNPKRKQINNLLDEISDTFGDMTDNFIKSFPSEKNYSSEAAIGAIDSSISKLSQGERFATKQQKAFKEALEDLRKKFFKEKPLPKTKQLAPANLMVESIKDINNLLVDAKTYGGALKTLLGLKDEANKALRPVKETFFGRKLVEANNRFAELAQKVTAEENMKNFIKTKNYRGIVNFADTPVRFDKLMDVFPKSNLEGRYSEEALTQFSNILKESDSLKNNFRKSLVENMVEKTLYNAKGEVTLGQTTNIFKTAEKKEMLKHLLGKEQFESLSRLQKISREIGSSLDRYRNTSKTALAGISYDNLQAPLTTISLALSKGSLLPFVFSPMAKNKTLKTFSRVLSNPELTSVYEKIAQANSIKDPVKFKQTMNVLIAQALKLVGDVASKEDLSFDDLGIEQNRN